MIVIGAGPHNSTHTLVAVDAATGEQRGCEAVPASTAGSERALGWARGLGGERVWAIEDCRHDSGRLERWLLVRGERIVRVPPKLMAAARKSARSAASPTRSTRWRSRGRRCGKVWTGCPRRGLRDARWRSGCCLTLTPSIWSPIAQDEQRRLRWHLHDLCDDLPIPAGALDREVWLGKVARRLSRCEQTVRVRIGREQVRSIRDATRRIRQFEREIAQLVELEAPQLLTEVGCGR